MRNKKDFFTRLKSTLSEAFHVSQKVNGTRDAIDLSLVHMSNISSCTTTVHNNGSDHFIRSVGIPSQK